MLVVCVGVCVFGLVVVAGGVDACGLAVLCVVVAVGADVVVCGCCVVCV